MVWDVSPILIQLGPFALRWYGLMFAAGFVLGLMMMNHIFRLEKKNVDEVSQMFIYIFVGTIVGARLGHCLFYEPEYYLSNPFEILMIQKGGLASHGGTIGIVVGVYLYCRKYKRNILWTLDRLSIAVVLASGCIRVGNLFNSEIIGRETKGHWAVVFKRIDLLPRHPTQVYEAICYFATFGLLYFLYRKTDLGKKAGGLVGVLLMCVFGARFFIEFVKENQVGFEEEMFLNMGQLLSTPFFLAGLFFLLRAQGVIKWGKR